MKKPTYASFDSRPNGYDRLGVDSSTSCCPSACPSFVGRFCTSDLRDEIGLLLKIGWPVIATNFLNSLILSVSIMMCGHLSKLELDAAALANSLINALGLSIGIGLCAACDTLFSQSFGSTNRRRVGTYLLQSLMIIGLCPFIIAAIHINILPILQALGQLPEVSRMTADYMLFFSPGLLFNFLFLVLARYLQNQDRVIPPMVCIAIGNVFNVTAQYVCIYVLNYGYLSSAICQAITFLLVFLLMLMYIIISGAYADTWNGWDSECLFNWWQFWRLALPGMGMVSLETFCWEIGTFVAGYMGEEELGAQSALFQAEGWTFMIALGLSISVNIRVGQNLGAMNGARAKLAWQAGICCLLCSAAVTATIFATCKDLIPWVFTNDETIASIASRVYPMLGLFQFIDGIGIVSAGALRGCGRQIVGTILVFIAYYVLGLPIGIPVALSTPLKVFGLWLGLLIGICFTAPAYVTLLSKQDWQWQAERAQDRIHSAEDKQRQYDTEAALEIAVATAAVPPGTGEASAAAAAAAAAAATATAAIGASEVTGLLSDNSSKNRLFSSGSGTKHRRMPSNPAFTSSTKIVPLKVKRHQDERQVQRMLVLRVLTMAGAVGILLIGIAVRAATQGFDLFDMRNMTTTTATTDNSLLNRTTAVMGV